MKIKKLNIIRNTTRNIYNLNLNMCYLKMYNNVNMRKLLIVTTETRRIKCKINTEINKAFINKNFPIIKCYFTKKRKTSSSRNNGHNLFSLH